MKTRGLILIAGILFIILLICCSAVQSEAFNLPDTGQTKCYRDVSPYDEIPCTGTGQDGEYNINPMSFTDNGNGTVMGNNTGLMWQRCSVGQNNNASCSGTAVTYNWYQASGTYDATYNPSSQDVCGSLTLGSYSDWRLPTKKELISIVDYSVPYPGPTINTTYFPNTKSSVYWLSTTNACNPNLAWYVIFNNGYVLSNSKNDYYYVRCVSGGQYPEQNFTDNGNGTVTDNSTGLVWQQSEPGYMRWGSALSYCEGLSLGGNTDWRLPNIRELESLTDDTRNSPAIDTSFFPNAKSFPYWSSTTNAYDPSYAWYVFFDNGQVDNYYKSSNDYVRCVRGGQVDNDNDGYTSDTDCDDSNPAINPGVPEIVNNGIDDDCNPATPTVSASGAGYNTPVPLFRASLSLNVTAPTTGWLKYYYTRNRLNFTSTSITGISATGGIATITGVGTVNGVNGCSFTATITDGAPDAMGIEIVPREACTTSYSVGSTAITSGNYTVVGE